MSSVFSGPFSEDMMGGMSLTVAVVMPVLVGVADESPPTVHFSVWRRKSLALECRERKREEEDEEEEEPEVEAEVGGVEEEAEAEVGVVKLFSCWGGGALDRDGGRMLAG